MTLRDDLLPELMLAWAMPEYWAILAVGATVFVLILSFRLARLAERRRESDRMLLTVHTEIEACCDRELLSQDERKTLITHLNEIDTKREIKKIADSYFGVRKLLLTGPHARTNDLNERDRIRSLLRDVEILANLRQRGRNIVELMVMALFAALTMFVALFVRPLIDGGAPEPYIAFTVELFAIAFSAAIGFMAFDLLDQRAERDIGLLRSVSNTARHKYSQPPGWRLNFDRYADPKADRIFAGILSIAVFAMFASLLVSKWF